MEKIIEVLTPVGTFNLLMTSLFESAQTLTTKTAYQADIMIRELPGGNQLLIDLTPKGNEFSTPLAQMNIQLGSTNSFEPSESAKKAFIKERNRRLCEANALIRVLIDAADHTPCDCAPGSITGDES